MLMRMMTTSNLREVRKRFNNEHGSKSYEFFESSK